jgi:hypothetical protein
LAARTTKTVLHQAWRDKIRTSMLINRLQNHVAGRLEMTPTQLRAAEVLLKKTMPDRTAAEVTGEGGGPIDLVAKIERVVVESSKPQDT